MNPQTPSQIAVEAAAGILHVGELLTQGWLELTIQSAIDKATEELREYKEGYDEVVRQREECRSRAEKAEAAGGFCEKHKPDGGHRNCLVCGCIELSFALDRISYLCGTPNEMQVSEYSTHYNAEAVVKQVQDKIEKSEATLKELIEDVKPLLSMLEEYKFTYHRRYSDFITKYADKLK